MYIVIVRLMRVSKMPNDMEYMLTWYIIILRQYRVLPWTAPCNWPHQIYQAVKEQFMGTVECRYNTVHFITILPSALRWQQQNINQTSKSQQTPHTSPSPASYGMSIVRIWGKKWTRYNAIVLYFFFAEKRLKSQCLPRSCEPNPKVV